MSNLVGVREHAEWLIKRLSERITELDALDTEISAHELRLSLMRDRYAAVEQEIRETGRAIAALPAAKDRDR